MGWSKVEEKIRMLSLKCKPKYRCLLTLVKRATIKSEQTGNAGEGSGKGEPSCTVGGNVN